MVKLTNLVHVRRRVILDVGLSRALLPARDDAAPGLVGPCENGEILLVNLLVFSGVCATVYLMTSHSFRSWRFVFMPDIVVMMRDIMIAGFIMIITLGGTRVLYRSLVKEACSPGSRFVAHRTGFVDLRMLASRFQLTR